MGVSFLAVFLKVWQQQNVIQRAFLSSAVTSYGIAAVEIGVVGFVVADGWKAFPALGTGGALGVMFSMLLHKKLIKEKKYQ